MDFTSRLDFLLHRRGVLAVRPIYVGARGPLSEHQPIPIEEGAVHGN